MQATRSLDAPPGAHPPLHVAEMASRSVAVVRSLSDRLFQRVFTLYVVITLCLYGVETMVTYLETRGEVAADLTRAGDMFGETLRHAVWNLDSSQIDLTLSSILKSPSVHRVQLLDPQGRVAIERTASRPVAAPERVHNLLPDSTLSYTLRIVREYQGQPRSLGTLVLYSNDGVIYDRLKVSVAMSAVSALFKAAVLLALFRTFFHASLSRPLLDIARRAASIDPGDPAALRLPVNEAHPDELDVISASLNRLLDGMTRTLHERDELYRGLQQRMEQLKLAQEDLIEAERLASLGSLVAGVAHEINTPVGLAYTGSTHFIDLVDGLQRAYREDMLERAEFESFMADSQELARSISSSLQRAANLVRSFTMVAVDQGVEELRWFSPRQYLEDVVLTHRTVTRRAGIEVVVTVEPEDFKTFSDPGAWAQIVSNLINNAVTHAFGEPCDGARVDVQVRRDEQMVDLVVADNGRGMAREVARRIYEPLFTTNRQKGGSGLGMHIVFNLVTQRLQGTINLTTAPGAGASFHIRMPLILRPRDDATAADRAASSD